MRVVDDDRPISLADLDAAWSELHRIEDSGDRRELLVALHRLQNRLAALFSQKVAEFP